MAKLLPDDFRDFLKLCNQKRVRYLLIGGYAVGRYGYTRATGDMDVWIERTTDNAVRMVAVLKAFGFDVPALSVELLMEEGKIVRMGVPPLRLEILNDISGVRFDECFRSRKRTMMDGIQVDVISLAHLKINKAASGRPKDLDDLEHLNELDG
jgi:predicted nucleotidyltransferase